MGMEERDTLPVSDTTSTDANRRAPEHDHFHLLPWMLPVRRPKLSYTVVVLPLVVDRPVLRPIES